MSILKNLLRNASRTRERNQTPPPVEVDSSPIWDLRENSKQAPASKQNSDACIQVEYAVNSMFLPWSVTGVTVGDRIWLIGNELSWSYHDPILTIGGRERFFALNLIETQISLVSWAQHWYRLNMKPETVAHLINYLWKQEWEKIRFPDRLLAGWLAGNVRAWDIAHLDGEEE